MKRNWTRRGFCKAVGVTGLATVAGSTVWVRRAPAASTRAVTLMTWSHFVPPFNPEVERQLAEWSKLRGAEARVDFIAVRDLPAKLAAEAEGQAGHDIIHLRLFDAALQRANLVELDDVAADLEKSMGPWLDPARYLCQVGGHWYGIPWYYWSLPATINTEHWRKIGLGPEDVAKLTWEGLLDPAEKLVKLGSPLGFALSETFDANDALYPVLWSFGGRTVDEKGKVVINSAETAAAIEYVKKLYKFMPREVLGWDDASNNVFMLNGTGAWTPNAPSVWAVARKDKMPVADKIDHVPLPAGARGQFRSASTLALGVWKFSPNIDLAKDLIRFLASKQNVSAQIAASWGFNQPFLGGNRGHKIYKDEPALRYYEPPLEQIRVPGWPGPANAGAQTAYTLFVVPVMFAKAVSGEASTADAIKWAEKTLNRLYWG